MNDKVRLVRLYGWLGKRFGREHRLAVASPAEAVRALCALLPGFEPALLASERRGVRFACFAGRRNLSQDELRHPVGADVIRIAPMLAGAKNGGLFQTMLGAVLIAAAAIYSGGVAAAFQAGGDGAGHGHHGIVHDAERRGPDAVAPAAAAQRQGPARQRRVL